MIKKFSINKQIALFFLFFTLILVGCTQNLAPQTDSRTYLLVDDFQRMTSAWDTLESTDGSAIGYYDGWLLFLINAPDKEYISTPKGIYSDIRLEAVAKKLSGSEDNYFGLVCRYQDENNYYAFLISSDGYFGVVKVLDGAYSLLNANMMQFSAAIYQGEEFNHLHAGCIGKDLIFYVNKQFLAAVQDDAFSSGEVGLFAGSGNEPNVAIGFDSFVILKPQ